MKVDIKKLEKSQIELKFKLSKEELNSFVDKATKSLGKDLEIKTGIFVCPNCGYITIDRAPGHCPVCGIPGNQFIKF